MDLKGAVKELRLHMGLSQTDFGSQLGVSLPTITRWERGGPPVDVFAQLIDCAEKQGRPDVSGVFKEDLERRYGRFLRVEKADYTSDERRYVDMLVRLLRDPDPGSQAVKRTLEGFIEAQKQREAMRQREQRTRR